MWLKLWTDKCSWISRFWGYLHIFIAFESANKKFRSQTHLVSDAQGDVTAWTGFKKKGRYQDVRIREIVRSRQERMSPLCAQGLHFSAHRFEPIAFLHWVQVSFLKEVPEVIGTRVGRVLPESKN